MKILLAGPDKAELRDVTFEHDASDSTRAVLNIDPAGFNKYYLLQEYNSSFNICMNYFWEIPELPNSISGKKAAAVINDKQNMVLVSPKKIDLNECTATFQLTLPNL